MPCLELHPRLKLEEQILHSPRLLPSPRFLCAWHGYSPTALHCSSSQPGLFIWPKLGKYIFPEPRLEKFRMAASDGDLHLQVHVKQQKGHYSKSLFS